MSAGFYASLRALIWGARLLACSFRPLIETLLRKSICLEPTFCRRQAASDCRLAACAPQNLTRGETTQENARWQTSGRAILNVVCC
ncbi:MAG: hypothetical protein DMF23_12770 [Verrucomicrobia bacterium]|nr:MAG: hypothetical protein DMF23_12770 [Verrucomicrobiota bacterium]